MGISDERKGFGGQSRGVCAVCMGVAGISLVLARGREGDREDQRGLGRVWRAEGFVRKKSVTR
jgi:hypothetical protein